MAEPKRYEEYILVHRHGGNDEADMRESTAGRYVTYDDYITLSREHDELRRAFERAEADVQALSREVEMLRMVEAAAIAVIDYPELDENFAEHMDALAEACGRKG